ncbi:MAG TPA: lysylphosphatidylglycerol synthase transmembrane domain-containing protein [Gaiellaceae bacterium]
MRKLSLRQRPARVAFTLGLTALCVWYIVAKIDLGESWRVLSESRLWLVALAFAILMLAVVPFSWRWQRLLRARGIDEGVPWLLRAYLVSYTAGQLLPTSLGGDATRIVETSRRHRGRGGAVAGSVLLERGLGGIATLLLGAVGFVLAIGRYSVGPYLWLELAMALATVALALVLFSKSARRPLRLAEPLLARVRLSGPVRALYLGLHEYRSDAQLVGSMLAVTAVVQSVRVLAIWLCGEAVGVHLSPLPYFVMGPMFFLVMLAPFTVNGLALREAFFVSFLGRLGVSADQAFAAGFLFLLLSFALSLPGGLIWAVERLRGSAQLSARTTVPAR